MRNFDTELDQAGVTRMTKQVAVVETVTVTPEPSKARGFVMKPEAEWEWRDLRDYVVLQIETYHGVFPRDAKKEYGIFSSFITRWGIEQAVAIARYAFDVAAGKWAGAPIGVNRFCKGSDPFFAQPIVERLAQQPVTAW